MIAAELDVTEDQLPDALEPLLGRIARRRSRPASARATTTWRRTADRWLAAHAAGDRARPRRRTTRAARQFGTLGSGNHFLEVCVDERGRVWVVLHSGSRGIGNQLAQAHIATARRLAKDLRPAARGPGPRLLRRGHAGVRRLHRRHALGAGLRPGQPRPDDGQRHARGARRSSASAARRRRINCHHNFTQREIHDGEPAVDHPQGRHQGRASATSASSPARWARAATSCAGKGNAASWTSCSHGAGRRHSRTQAKKLFTRRRPRAADGGQDVAVGPGPRRSSTRSRRPTRTSTR